MAINFPTNPVDGQTFVALSRGWQYNSSASAWEALIRVNTAFSSDDITEGTTNLYQNPENIQDEVNNLLVAGSNITLTYNDVANSLTIDSAGGGGGGGSTLAIQDEGTALATDATTLNFVGAGVTATGNGATKTITIAGGGGGSPFGTNILPDTTNTRDIGSTSKKWKDLHMQGNAVIDGNLTVNGTQTTITSTQLAVNDLNITIASGAADAATANGAGITVDGASATLTYTSADDRWNLNKELNVATVHGNVTGNVTGTTSDISNHSIDALSDVDTTTAAPTTGQTIIWNGTNFVPGAAFSTSDFNTAFSGKNVQDLSNVDVTGITNGQTLVWDNANSKFIAGAGGGGGGGYSTANFNTDFAAKDIGDLGNVFTTGVANNHVLIYNSSNSRYESSLIGVNSLNSTQAFVDQFTANGAVSSFTLSQTPGNKAYVQVFVDSVPQLDTGITLSGTTLTLGGTPSAGQIVEARIYGIANVIGSPSDGTVTNAKLALTYTSNQYTGNGTLTAFAVPVDHSVDSLLVILDGIIIPPADYTVSGTTLTFGAAPSNGQSIDIRYLPV